MDVALLPCGGMMKPEVVFLGKTVRDMDSAQHEGLKSDIFFVLGCSLAVYPAVLLPQYAGGAVAVVNQGGEVVLGPSALQRPEFGLSTQ